MIMIDTSRRHILKRDGKKTTLFGTLKGSVLNVMATMALRRQASFCSGSYASYDEARAALWDEPADRIARSDPTALVQLMR
jgi:hypothetical protein